METDVGGLKGEVAMKRMVGYALAGATAVGCAAAGVVRHQLTELLQPVSGTFANGMPYLRIGSGPKSVVFMPGGPAHDIRTDGFATWYLGRLFRPFLNNGYTMWLVARRPNMPTGYSVEAMAHDYATAIAEDLGGKIDLAIGAEPYGGMIAFALAARHAERCDHLAVVCAGYELSEQGKQLERGFATFMSQGRTRDAGALLFRFTFPKIPPSPADRVLGAALVWLAYGKTPAHFANDVVVEAEAVASFDGRSILAQIPGPVLVIGCDRDPEFPKEVYDEPADSSRTAP